MVKKKVLGLVLLTSLISSTVFAAEETVTVDGVNYVDVQKISAKYNVSYTDLGTDIQLRNTSTEVVIPKEGRATFYLNGEDYLGIRPTFVQQGRSFITAKDFAGLFNLMLTYVDGVTTMTPTEKEPIFNDNYFDNGVYKIGKSWGNKTPMTVVRNKPPANVTTPTLERPAYYVESHNEIQDEVQK